MSGIVRGTILGLLIFVLFGCSGKTEYFLLFDGFSFLPEESISKELPIPEGLAITVYILPGIHIDLDETGPGDNEKRGLAVTIPTPSPPDPVKLSFELSGRIAVLNRETDKMLHTFILEVFIADVGAVNIYEEGQRVFLLKSENINPLEERNVVIESIIGPASDKYELIKDGNFRVGVRFILQHEELQIVFIRYNIRSLDISISGYPFGFL